MGIEIIAHSNHTQHYPCFQQVENSALDIGVVTKFPPGESVQI